uniref:PKD domain-containing protein n=1 Tax=Alkalihalobacillus sp. BA299 TaxID=2815938 RepID=UPI001FFE02FB
YYIDKVNPNGTFSPNSKSWTNSNITVGLDVSDSRSGIKQFRYRTYSNGTWSSYSSWITGTSTDITLSTEGQNRIHIQSEDKAGNIGNDYSGYYYIDKVNPNGTFSPNSKSWTNSNITVGLDVSDSRSGIKQFRYRTYSNGTWSSYSSWITGTSTDITLSTEGQNRIHIQSEDKAGNIGNDYSGYYYIDKTDPNNYSHGITGHTYKNGDNYWVKPNQSLDVRLRAYDYSSRVYLSYIRLYGSSDARSQHNWNSSDSTHLNNYLTSSDIIVNSVSRTYKSSDNRYKEVTFNVTPKTHGQYYNVYSLYRDNATNWSDNYSWYSTGMTIRTDAVAPTHVSNGVYGARFVNGGDYWIRPNDNVDIRVRQNDPHSGNKFQNLRFTGSDVDARSQHLFSNSSTHNNHWMTSSHVSINSAHREENTNYGRVLWNVTAKTHGHTYDIQYYFRDNVNNSRGYLNTGKRLRIDGVAPSVVYRNKEDTSNFTSRDWSDDDIEVRLKYSDSHSGYKRSRYVWTLSPSTPSESEWSAWTTDSNYVVTKTTKGKWYLHTQMQDNVGNTRTVVNGEYRLNHYPVAGFEFDSGTYYIGDAISVTSLSYDPDGDPITHDYEITKPDNTKVTFTTPNFTYVPDIPGNYKFTLTVTDNTGFSDTVSATIYVNDLTLTGKVLHTPEWESKHDALGHDPLEFYSGEKFILEADVTDYPIDYVTVDFEGTQDNGNLYTRTITLSYASPTLYSGELFDSQFTETGTTLKNGTVKFTFTVRYENGIVKTDVVYPTIIGSVWDYFKIHRRY